MAKCESLIRSRWVPESKDEKGNIVRGYWKRLPDPEACAKDGTEYRIRKKAKKPQKHRDKPTAFSFCAGLELPPGAMWVRTSLCDKHKKKAEREGNEVLPCENICANV